MLSKGSRLECSSARRAITERQRAVAALVVRGLSNPEVAHVLAISINTVKKHVRELFERCDVASRAELAATLVASGLVEPADR